MVGRKLTLWREEYRRDAYFDQFGMPHRGRLVVEEIPVTVVEEKSVSGDYGSESDSYKGLRALARDGRVFVQNWDYFPETSLMPTYYWFHFKGDISNPTDVYEVVDSIQAANHNKLYGPYVHADGTRAIPQHENVRYCAKHDYFHGGGAATTICWRCK